MDFLYFSLVGKYWQHMDSIPSCPVSSMGVEWRHTWAFFPCLVLAMAWGAGSGLFAHTDSAARADRVSSMTPPDYRSFRSPAVLFTNTSWQLHCTTHTAFVHWHQHVAIDSQYKSTKKPSNCLLWNVRKSKSQKWKAELRTSDWSSFKNCILLLCVVIIFIWTYPVSCVVF